MDTPPLSVFISRSALGKMVLSHNGMILEILGTRFGKRIKRNLDLRDLSPEIGCEVKSYYGRLLGSVVLLLGGITGAKFLWGYGDTYIFFYFCSLASAIFGCANVFIWSRRFLFVVFEDRKGREVFSIVCQSDQREECETFLAELVYSIEHPGRLLPQDVELDPNPHADSDRQSSVVYHTVPDPVNIFPDLDQNESSELALISVHTLFSLVGGLLALLLPASDRFMDSLGEMSSTVILSCSGFAVSNGVFALMKKEYLRLCAIFGILMGMAPPFIYI